MTCALKMISIDLMTVQVQGENTSLGIWHFINARNKSETVERSIKLPNNKDVIVNGQELEEVEELRYLDSKLMQGASTVELDNQAGSCYMVFNKTKHLLETKNTNAAVRLKLYTLRVISDCLYDSKHAHDTHCREADSNPGLRN